jgi:hypothetical protein
MPSPELRFEELDEDHLQALRTGPQRLSQRSGGLAFAIARVNLYQPFKILFCHEVLRK